MVDKRRQAIADVVNQLGEISVRELKNLFPDTSEVTLRKDLQALDESKQLIRIHGGARSIDDVSQRVSNFSTRKLLHQAEKAAIGEKASKLLEEGMAVYISSGSTCMELAKRIAVKSLHVFTDGISIALETPISPAVSVELLGGLVNRNLMRLTGPTVLSALDMLYFDYAFIGTIGFNERAGFSVSTPNIAASCYKAIEHSRKTVILMDSSKVNQLCSPRNIPFKSVDVVISDDGLPQDTAALLEQHGITVL